MSTMPARLGLVDHWESELSAARLAADALRARLALDPGSVTRSEWADAEAAEKFAELALAGAVNADRQATVAAELARAEELVVELRDTYHGDLAVTLPALVDDVTTAVDALLAAADSYSGGIARIVVELGRLEHLPDSIEVERSGLGAKVVTVDGVSYRPDRSLAPMLVLVGVAKAAVKAGVPLPLDRNTTTWKELAAKVEGIWSRLRAAHPGHADAFPATPGLQAARDARQAERAALARGEERRRAASLLRAVEDAEGAWRNYSRMQPAEELIRQGLWPEGRPYPWDDEGSAVAPVDTPGGANGRPRRLRTPRPSDDLPPAA